MWMLVLRTRKDASSHEEWFFQYKIDYNHYAERSKPRLAIEDPGQAK